MIKSLLNKLFMKKQLYSLRMKEDVRKMLQNNELMKKTDSTEEAPGLFVKGQRGRSKGRGSKRDPKASSSFSCYFCKKLRHIKKNCMEYK